MRRIEEPQTFKPELAIPDRSCIVDQSIRNSSTDSLPTICGRNIHALDLAHTCFQFLQTTHTRKLIFVPGKVETAVRRVKFVRIGQIRTHHSLDVELDAILALESIVQPFEIFADKRAGFILLLLTLNLLKSDFIQRATPLTVIMR
jgi:hypothetical protein